MAMGPFLPELSRRQCLLAAATLVASRGVSAESAGAVNFSTVLARLRADYLGQISPGDAARQAGRQLPSGLWPDVEYGDRSVGIWRAMRHLERLRGIAVAFNLSGHALKGSPVARAAVESGLHAWLEQKPASDNWWHNTIGQQLALAPVLVLMKDELTAELRAAGTAMLYDASMVPVGQAAGQNLVWYANEQLVRGVLRADAVDLQSASHALQSTLFVTREEGIQADFSFHQHGAQLYSGGYGLGFVQDSARAAAWLAGTPWAFRQDRLALLADYALQGIVPLIRGSWLDWGARGREFTRLERTPRPKVLLPALRTLQALVPTKAAALAAVADPIQADPLGAKVLGNRYYWRSDFMVHQTVNGYWSVKMVSARTVGTESGNGENLLGYWLPFGVTYTLRRGDEYDGLPGAWDWSALPGLTAPDEVPAFTGYQKHSERFVGGLSNGSSGIAAMALNKLDTQGRRAWFFHDDLMVALGAGIRSAREQPVRTTLNQTVWKGDVHSNLGPLKTSAAAPALNELRWVWHDGVTYLLNDAPGPDLALGARSVRAGSINLEMGARSGEVNVFRLTLNHGVKPRDAHYAYGVWLGAPTAGATSISPPAFTVLANSALLQAVRHDSARLTQAAFHAPVPLEIEPALAIVPAAPCLCMVQELPDAWQISVSDPTASLPSIAIELRQVGAARRTVQLTLPTPDANVAPQAMFHVGRSR